MRSRNVSLFAGTSEAQEGSRENLGRHPSNTSVNNSHGVGASGGRTSSTSRLSPSAVGGGSSRLDATNSFTVTNISDIASKRGSSSLHLLSPSPSMMTAAASTPSLPSRNGSKVFPTLLLAQRSASVLMRHRSTLQEFARKRSTSTMEAQQQGGGAGHSENMSSSSPVAAAAAAAGSLGARRDSSGSALERISRAASSVGFTNDEWLGQCGALHHRQPVALKTVGMAVLMLVRIHRAMRKRRVAVQQLRNASTNANDDVTNSTPAASLPTTARQRGSQTPLAAAQRGTSTAAATVMTRAAPAVAAATAHSADVLALPQVATQFSFASCTSSAPLHREASLAGSSSSGSSSRDGLDDDISIASTNSNDIIEEEDDLDHDGPDSDKEQHRGGDGEFLSDASLMPVVVHRSKFFPHPQDISQLPEPIQRNIERRARRSLCRFVAVYRFYRYLKQRKQRRSKFSLTAVPEGALETSPVLRGWPTPLIDEAVSSGYVQSCFPNSYVVYPSEPNSVVVFLLSGTLLELSRTNPAVKRVAPHRNATVVGTYTTPCVLRDTAAIVEDSRSRDFGLFALTTCTVAFVSATRIADVFRKAVVAEPWNAQLLALSTRYRNLRRDRTLEFLEATYARLAAADSVLLQLDATAASGATTRQGLLPPAPAGMSDYQLALRSSPLFQRLTREQERLILPRLLPMSFIEGDEILSKGDEDFRNLYFILRGSVVSVSRYRDAGDADDDGANTRRRRSRRNPTSASSPRSASSGPATAGEWRTMVFSRWVAGQSVGDKAIYFQEPPVFSLMAETHCDVAVLKRSVLMNILETSDRVGLKACIASGAFLVRASDPRVRLRLQSVRAIPCIEAAVSQGLVTEAFVRELHSKFSIHVFPAKELICSASETVKQILVVSTGKALVDPTGPTPYALPPGLPIGGAVLCDVRWRVAVLAVTECEGWVLPLDQFLGICKQHRVERQMRKLSQEQYQLMMRTDAAESTVMEVPTPQSVVMTVLAAAGDAVAKAKQSSLVVRPSKKLLEQRSYYQHPPPGMPMPPPPSNRAKQKASAGATSENGASVAAVSENRVATAATHQQTSIPRFYVSAAESTEGTETPPTPPPQSSPAATATGGGALTRRLSIGTSYSVEHHREVSEDNAAVRDNAVVDPEEVGHVVTSHSADIEPSLVPSLSIAGAADVSRQPLVETSRDFRSPPSSRPSTCLSTASGKTRSTRWLNYLRALVRSTSIDEFGGTAAGDSLEGPRRLRCSPFRDEEEGVTLTPVSSALAPCGGGGGVAPIQAVSSPSFSRPQSAAAALSRYSPTGFYKTRLVERIRRDAQANTQPPLLLPPRPSTAGFLVSTNASADVAVCGTDAPRQLDLQSDVSGQNNRLHSSTSSTWHRSTSAPHTRRGVPLTENKNAAKVGTFAWCRMSPCASTSLRLSAGAHIRSATSATDPRVAETIRPCLSS